MSDNIVEEIETIVDKNGYTPENFRLKDLIPPVNHFLVRLLPVEETVRNGIVIPNLRTSMLTPYGVIIRSGDAFGDYTDVMKNYRVGDMVMLQVGCGAKEEDIENKQKYCVIFATHVLGKFGNVLDWESKKDN